MGLLNRPDGALVVEALPYSGAEQSPLIFPRLGGLL